MTMRLTAAKLFPRIAVLAPLVILAGCLTPLYTMPPEGIPTATVTFVPGPDASLVRAGTYQDQTCLDRRHIGNFGWDNNTGLARLAGEKPKVRPLTTKLPASGRVVTTLSYSSGYPVTTSCGLVVAFDPVPDRHYEVFFNINFNRCVATVVEVQDGLRKPVPTFKPTARECRA
jgi:hypothetical protein